MMSCYRSHHHRLFLTSYLQNDRHVWNGVLTSVSCFRRGERKFGISTTAFIGLGNMGLPMCRNLYEGLVKNTDHQSNFFVLDSKISNISTPKGTIPFSSLSDLVNAAYEKGDGFDTVVLALPNDKAVNSVMSEFMNHLKSKEDRLKSTLFIDTSTISPLTTQALSDNLLKQFHGLHKYIDAPMSGGVKGAEQSTLTFMVGCNNDATFELSKVTLSKMGTKIFRCGGIGMGGVAKLCNNLALGVQMIGICEAMNLGDKLGIDPTILSNVMNSSTAKCWSSETNNPHPSVASLTGSPASRNYDTGFGVSLMLKDIGLAIDAGNNNKHIALPLSSAARQLYCLAENHGYGNKDFSIIFELLKGRS